LTPSGFLLPPIRFIVPIGKGVCGLPYIPWATATAALVVAIKGASLVVCWLPSVADAAGTKFAARSTARLAEEAEAGALTIGACGTNQYEHERVVFIPRGRYMTVLGNSPEPFCGYFVGVPCKGDGASNVDEVKRAAAALQAQISRRSSHGCTVDTTTTASQRRRRCDAHAGALGCFVGTPSLVWQNWGTLVGAADADET